ncbi:MAG: hypothetical protein RBR87_14815, partial [Bacteroidales bacterium]|nr:hypothetical protein [Bacteroidales bacterium]
AAFDAGCCHELYYTLLFDKQFVPYCTTKYIFWLGKNKFDRGGHRVERCQFIMVNSFKRIGS